MCCINNMQSVPEMDETIYIPWRILCADAVIEKVAGTFHLIFLMNNILFFFQNYIYSFVLIHQFISCFIVSVSIQSMVNSHISKITITKDLIFCCYNMIYYINIFRHIYIDTNLINVLFRRTNFIW